jgi:hypothetical protein
MIGPTRSKIISQHNNNYTSHNPTPCSDIGDISDVGKEEGSEEGRDSPTIKQTQNIHKNISKTEKVKKNEYYNAHKNMHTMYSEQPVKDMYDLINDDTIDLQQCTSICDSSSYIYSDA